MTAMQADLVPVVERVPSMTVKPRAVPPDEDDLSERARLGDEAALLELWSRYERQISAYCAQILLNSQDGEDLAQEVFVKAWRYIGRGDGPMKFGAWVYRIARNACLDVRRHRQVVQFEWLPESESAYPLIAPPGEQPYPQCCRRETAAETWRVLRAITEPRYRRVLYLREFCELSHDEIAASEGITLSAVKACLFRAREAFRKEAKRQRVVFQP